MDTQNDPSRKQHVLLFAQHEPALCLAPGLFQTLSAKSRSAEKLHVVYNFNLSTQLTYTGPEKLGVDDMRILQGLVGFATLTAKRYEQSTEVPPQDVQRLLVERLKIEGNSAEPSVQILNTTYPQLAIEVGYSSPSGGSTYTKVAASVARLSQVRVVQLTHGDGRFEEQSFQLIAYIEVVSSRKRELFVALNPRLSAATQAKAGKQYFRIDLSEARRLRSDATRLLHQRLHWLNPGSKDSLRWETLASYVWHDETDNPHTQKTRLRALKKHLSELRMAGWSVSFDDPGLVDIKRPSSAVLQRRKQTQSKAPNNVI